MSKRALSIEYWKARTDESAFLAFLLCTTKRRDIPPLCKDVKQLLYMHVKRLLKFHVPHAKKCIELVHTIDVTFPPDSLQCHSIWAKNMGKTAVRVKIALKVINANDIRSVENRIIDSIPGIQYRRRLSNRDILSFNVTMYREYGDFDYVPYNNEYVPAQKPIRMFDPPLEKGAFVQRSLVMVITGICKRNSWFMVFSLI